MTQARQKLVELLEQIKQNQIEIFDKLINATKSGAKGIEIINLMDELSNETITEKQQKEIKSIFMQLMIEEVAKDIKDIVQETTNNGGNA